MKTKLVLSVMITSLFFLYGCSNNEDSILDSAPKSSVINQMYPQAQAKVLETFGAIGASITNGAGEGYGFPFVDDDPNANEYMDQLISFHDYSNIFTEFNYDFNGYGYLTDSEGNEDHERTLFGVYVKPGGVKKFAALDNDIKVAVYFGNVANVTFISDFVLDTYPLGEITVKNLITLLFVKTKGEWKMVHEHHSPLKVLPSTGPKPSNILSEFDPSSASDAQLEVLATFMAIGATVLENSGDGPGSMDELISFHAYGPKFTEFNYDSEGNGYLFDSEGNERNERAFENLKVTKFAAKPGTLNIAVYHRNVANVTFISDFEVDGIGTINNLITLLFVKTKGEWKLVHEHHSPENH